MVTTEQFKPGASRAARLAVAALIWTLAGLALTVDGLRWLASYGPLWLVLGAAASGAVGLAKGRLLLIPRAEVNARRIEGSGEARCLFGVFSWPMWGLVVTMMAGGRLLRAVPLPRYWLGLVYTAVGMALLGSSLIYWSRWRRISLAASISASTSDGPIQ